MLIRSRDKNDPGFGPNKGQQVESRAAPEMHVQENEIIVVGLQSGRRFGESCRFADQFDVVFQTQYSAQGGAGRGFVLDNKGAHGG